MIGTEMWRTGVRRYRDWLIALAGITVAIALYFNSPLLKIVAVIFSLVALLLIFYWAKEVERRKMKRK